ncbi:MAG: M20/M25/M40 family metallo-hydrolase [Verrucomicrobiaceae bacterium]|nr:M20/M25/M40 family metallo-hydrolase [Verrucomicrobiaceae bacterium]
MAQSLTSILKRLLKLPTAPFHEYHVRAEIEAILKDCPNVKLKCDKFGNLLATYKNGTSRSKPTWVFGAHMDHPAFVQGEDGWEFLGGSVTPEMDGAIKSGLRKSHGEIATWNFPVKVTGTRIEAPACDDLIGCAIIVSTLLELARLEIKTTVHAVFTRAEEVGWLGAWHLAQNWPFGKDSVFVSIETSRPVNGAVMGEGPMVRVGDRMSVFDSEAVAILSKTAKEQAIRVQRCLLDAGACEATAVQAAGIRSVGISVPLGNYHNIGVQRQISPEYVMMDDVKSLIDLLKALVATKHDGIGERTIRERVEIRMAEHAEHYKAGSKLFE